MPSFDRRSPYDDGRESGGNRGGTGEKESGRLGERAGALAGVVG